MNDASYAELSSITNKDGTRASTKVIHSVDREVTSDLQFGTSWAEVDVTDDAPHRHSEGVHLMSSSNHYHGSELRL